MMENIKVGIRVLKWMCGTLLALIFLVIGFQFDINQKAYETKTTVAIVSSKLDSHLKQHEESEFFWRKMFADLIPDIDRKPKDKEKKEYYAKEGEG